MHFEIRNFEIALLFILLWQPVSVSSAATPGLAAVLTGEPEASASNPETAAEAEKAADIPVAEKRTAVEEQIRVAQQALRESNEEEATSSSAEGQLVDLLKQLDLAYAQLESAATRREELEKALKERQAELQALQISGPQEEKPYQFSLKERLQDQLASQRDRLKSISTTIETASQSFMRAKETFESKEKQRRHAKEATASSDEPAKKSELAGALQLAEQESKIAEAKVKVREAELVNVKLEKESLLHQVQYLDEKLKVVASEVQFSKDDLDQWLRELSQQESKINRETKENDYEVEILRSQLKTARDPYESTAEPSAALQAQVDARQKKLTLCTYRTELLNRQNAWLQKLRSMWHYRHGVANELFESADLAKWRAEAEAFLEELTTEKTTLGTRQEEFRNELANIDRALAQDIPVEVSSWLTIHGDAIREILKFMNDHVVRLESTDRTVKKLIDEIRARTSQFSLAEWVGVICHKIQLVWDYELLSSDQDQPLRVSAVVCGLLLLVLGFMFSRRLSSAFGDRILPRFGVNEGGAAALQSLSFYALLFTTTLMALKVVSVPLTMFTFLGGAAAIGIGFGSQNVLNNFISGLILLTEQPVRVGDLIELNGLIGSVDTIGMRSTRIRTGSNHEIIVPNSSFLENNVVNWTLADSVIRCDVTVGVTYGSPTRDAAKWLKRAAEEHGLVLKKPEPFVWFAGFGDNSLNFELYFFITIRTLSERRRIESDLRFMIDQYFRDAGISIAFPQRDVHLDVRRPLEVTMLPAEQPVQIEQEITEAKAA